MRVNYAIIFVSDMKRAVSFYRDVLGLPLKFETPGWTEFATEGATLALHVSAAGSPRDNPQQPSAGRCRPGLSVPRLDEFHKRMIERNVPCLQEPKEVFGARIAQYVDPDGLAISVSEERSAVSTGAEHEVVAVEKEWGRAIVNNDADAIGRFMADDWTIVGPDGRVSDKASFLELVRSGALTHDVMDAADLQVRVFGDTAIVTSQSVSGGTYQGQPFRELERVSDVFVKQQGQWKCVLTHLSRLATT